MHKKVFIDTSVFIGNQFDFGNKLFETLIEHAQAERIDILLPEITVREIRGKADEVVEEAIQSLQKAVQKGAVLRPLGTPYPNCTTRSISYRQKQRYSQASTGSWRRQKSKCCQLQAMP